MNRFLLVVFFCQILTLTIFAQTPEYVPNTVVVKLDESPNGAKGLAELDLSILSKTKGVQAVKSMKPLSAQQQRGTSASVLDGLYKITLNSSMEEQYFIEQLSKYGNILYAERYPNVQPLEIPNDPQAKTNGAQYYLANIKAYDAWTNTRGDATIKIAIVDTGVDLDHDDLVANLYTNEGDIIDGIDNDGDGYIDNYYGWDFADNDNGVEADTDDHGTLVAGIAAAATNNGIGMAGIGYNTKFMPIKIFASESNVSFNSYEGIIYAADQGCDVINLSWGNTNGYNQFAQDIINYAVLEKNAVVVAAAGNTNANLDFYPASYDHVLSVSFTDRSDLKSTTSTYGNMIDLVAPGDLIYTTTNNNSFTTEGGSSLAAPMVAGAAALVKSFYPTYSAIEIMEQIRVNTDDIYGLGNNAVYRNLLGSGRLNVFKAINNRNAPSVRITDYNYTNGFEEAAYYNDTITFNIEVKSFLADVSRLSISLATESEYVQVLDSMWYVGSLEEGASTQNTLNSFRVVLSSDLPENELLYFRFNMEGEFYEAYQTIKIKSNPQSEVFQFNNWAFSLSSTANIGNSKTNLYNYQQVRYNGINVLKHQGLAVIAASDSISKNIAISPRNNNYAEDFISNEKLKRFNDITSDLDIRSTFEEVASVESPLGVKLSQRLLGWNNSEASGFLILNYSLQNLGTQNYDSLYVNLFSDWAVISNDYNHLSYDETAGIVYATDTVNNLMAGIALLTNGDSIFTALDIGALNGHTSDLLNDTLSNEQLFIANKQAFNKIAAGQLAAGNDVASLYGMLLKEFNTAAVQEINFALLAGGSLTDLQSNLVTARAYLQRKDTLIPFGQQIVLCKGEDAVFYSNSGDSIFIYDSPTAQISSFAGDTLLLNEVNKDSVLYYQTKGVDGFLSMKKRLLIALTKPNALFEVEEEPYLLDPQSTTLIQFIDESEAGVDRYWDFGNGYQSTQKKPKIPFTEAGSFKVTLISYNDIGCSDTLTQTIETAFRAPKPQIANQLVCRGSFVELFDPVLSEIHVYSDSLATNLIYQGPTYTIENIQSQQTIFVRNETETYPSIVKKVTINIASVNASLSVQNDLQSNAVLLQALAINESGADNVAWYLNNELIGTDDSVYFTTSNYQVGDLLLIAYNEFGCADSAVYQQQASVMPNFDDYLLCQGQSVLIKAENTSSLYFFQDESLTEFIGKGSVLQLDNVTAETEVFAVNVADIIPSPSVKVPLYISGVIASFKLSQDTINLAFENEVIATADETTASSWSWDLGNGTEKTGQTITLDYEQPGVYKLVLSVADSLGCVESSFQELVVLNNPLLGNKQQLKKFFKIFPNPANRFIHIEGVANFSFDNYKIIDMNGIEMLSSANEMTSQRAKVIDISKIAEGIYVLVIEKGGHKASFMFLIKR